MTEDALPLTPSTLLVFIDETGIENFRDPNNPTFGRGGCAVLGCDYKRLIVRPWRKLKRWKLGGANKQFHAVDFEQSKPSLRQIYAINRFLTGKFWRFAAMADNRTNLPDGIDGHKAISLVTIKFLQRLVGTSISDTVALVFENSDRGNKLVERDFHLAEMDLRNKAGRRIEVDGYFMPKQSMEAGMEVADLVAHTAGRQRRHELAGKDGVTKDFEQMYWHSPIPPAFMAIDNVQLEELAIEDDNGAEAAK